MMETLKLIIQYQKIIECAFNFQRAQLAEEMYNHKCPTDWFCKKMQRKKKANIQSQSSYCTLPLCEDTFERTLGYD